MNLKLRRLCDKVARANRLNTRGLRSFRREFEKAYKAQHAALVTALSGFAGKPYNTETCDAMMAAVLDTLPRAPVMEFIESVTSGADRSVTVTLTPEFSKILRQAQPEPQ